MTAIEYTWEIISTTDDGMIVEYTNPEHGTLQVGTRLPYEGETLEEVIEAASPAMWWHDLTRPKLDVAIGTTGSGSSAIGPTEPEPELSILPLTARQLRLGLVAASILPSHVDAAIAAISDDNDRAVAEIEWEYASQFERDHPLIEQVGMALGLTPEQIDSMWQSALLL